MMDDPLGTVKVKAEKEEDPEIVRLAEELAEKNRQKMLSSQSQQQQQMQQSQLSMQRAGGQQLLTNYFRNGNGTDAIDPEAKRKAEEKKKGAIDDESVKGRFGWIKISEHDVPHIFRREDKYVAVKMVETGILNKYLSMLPQEITTCINVRSYFITDNEAKLLHEINCRHCDYQFHKDAYSKNDVIVRASEAKAFYQFLETCYMKLCVKPIEPSEFCGFVRINGESVVPYTVKDLRKYVPLFYFEGETETLKLKAEKIDGWELAYLKFCCKVQGIRNELFASDTCAVVSLDDVKQYFPKDTQFEDWWPAKTAEPMRVTANNNTRNNMNWLQKPAQQPPSRPSPTVPQQNGNGRLPSQQPVAARNHHQPQPQPHSGYGQYNHLAASTNGYPKSSHQQQQQHRSSKHHQSASAAMAPTSNASLLNAYNSLLTGSNSAAASSLLGRGNASAANLMAQNNLLSMYGGYNQGGLNYQTSQQELQRIVSQLAGSTAAATNAAQLAAIIQQQQQQQQYSAAASALSSSSRRMPSQHHSSSSASRHTGSASSSSRQQQQQQQMAAQHYNFSLEALINATRTTYAPAQTTNSQHHVRSTRANKRTRM